jgi:hypothetical protein
LTVLCFSGIRTKDNLLAEVSMTLLRQGMCSIVNFLQSFSSRLKISKR